MGHTTLLPNGKVLTVDCYTDHNFLTPGNPYRLPGYRPRLEAEFG